MCLEGVISVYKARAERAGQKSRFWDVESHPACVSWLKLYGLRSSRKVDSSPDDMSEQKAILWIRDFSNE